MSDRPPSRRLVALISTHGKSKEQVAAEVMAALQKYLDAHPPPDDAAPESD